MRELKAGLYQNLTELKKMRYRIYLIFVNEVGIIRYQILLTLKGFIVFNNDIFCVYSKDSYLFHIAQ